ncbi:MAG: HD domain-containing protein [Acetobacter sp.]|nr:HD domain-containing protein [Acetobacter sp.]
MKKLLQYSEKLKHLSRTGWMRKGIETPESVAAHSWQMALMALALSGTIETRYDFIKVIKLCLCHDLAESVIGDLTPHDSGYSRKSEREQAAINKIAEEGDFPEAILLFEEYEENQTPEARFAHDLDKIDMYAQSLAYEKKYPQIDLSEFRQSAATKIQTQLGMALLNDLAKEKAPRRRSCKN